MKHLVYIICIIACGGCRPSDKEKNIPVSVSAKKNVVYDSLPSNAYSVAENEEWNIFLNDETIEDSIEGLGSIKQVSLWTYSKSKKSGKKLMMSHPHSGFKVMKGQSIEVPLDSIPTISKVTILSWKGEPLKLLVEGSQDYRNIQSFIIEADSSNATYLPTNRGFIGVSEEDGLLIMESYDYYEDGGRFNVIETYNLNGICISTMEARVRNKQR